MTKTGGSLYPIQSCGAESADGVEGVPDLPAVLQEDKDPLYPFTHVAAGLDRQDSAPTRYIVIIDDNGIPLLDKVLCELL